MRGMETREKFTAAVEAYLKRTGMSGRRFGLEAMNDAAFIHRMRASGGAANYTMATVERVRAFMRDHPPAKKKKMTDETRTSV